MAKPEIRLKGFEGEWESYLLGEVGFTISGVGFPDKEQGGLSGIPFYKVSDMNIEGNEFVMQSSNNYVTRNQIKKNNWKVCEKPALIFAKVGAAVLLNRKRLVLSPCMCDNNTMLFCFDESKWEPYFCLSLFQKVNLASLAQTGSLPSYNGTMVEGLSVYIPNDFAEQEYCANFFKFLDSIIQSTTKKIASLRQMKSACLVSMFPQAGETTPRVRFKGFEGEWNYLSMSDIFMERHDISTIMERLPQLSFTIEEGVIRPEDRKTNKRDFLIKDKSNKKYLVTRLDDIIYNPANVIYGAIHKNSLCDGVVSPIYKIFYTQQDPSFMECVVRRPEFIQEMTIYMEGTVQKLRTLKPEAFLRMSAYIAPSLEEQKKIGNYFRTLDKQISLQEKRLEKLKQIKAACLDKMFV